MSRGEEKPKRWRFGLRSVFGLFALFGFEIWLLQHGPLFYFFAPLFIAIVLEVAGHSRAANVAAIATIFFWVCFPCVFGIIETIRG